MKLFTIILTISCVLLSQDVCRAAPTDEVNQLALETGPQNIAVVASQTSSVTLPCCVTSGSISTARVQWWEYGTRSNGNQISDGSSLSSFHPNNARYRMDSDGKCYNLTINPINRSDGTKYMCMDVNDDPPNIVQLGAQLVVIDDVPACVSALNSTATALESAYYTMECTLTFNASYPIAPLMTWSTAPSVVVHNVVSRNSVRSWISFVADRTMNDVTFSMTVNFTSNGFTGADMATNIPAWQYTPPSSPIVVYWPPSGISISPDQPSYEIGDVLTCNSDANPAANYNWLAVEGPVAGMTWQGQSIQLTIDLVGDNILRCHAENTINCGVFAQDNHFNVTVNPYNACQSNPCQYGGTCVRDVNNYYCRCIPGVTGTNCETAINYCVSAPCLNGGTCFPGVNYYQCICDAAFTGRLCETPL